MTFRDDGDAMRARLEVLERERDEALQEVGRLQVENRQATERAEEAEQTATGLQAKLAGRRSPPFTNVRVLAVALVLLLACAGAYVALGSSAELQRAQARRAEVEAQLEQVQQELERARQSERESADVHEQLLRKIQDLSAPEPQPAEPAPPNLLEQMVQSAVVASTRVTQTWAARVRTVSGAAPVRRGQSCAVQAQMERAGDEVSHVTVDVVCGDTKLYDWNEPIGSGMQMRGCRPAEAQQAGGLVVDLECSDQGARTGRPQFALDTAHRTSTVWREGVPTWRVELSLSRPR